LSNRFNLKLVKSTVDTFFNNQIKIIQPETGYRYSMDPVILAAQVIPFPGCKIIDIGCGCGIIPLILGFRYKNIHITGVEIQPELAEMARKNIAENQMSHQIQILHQDIKATRPSDFKGPADIVVANPPYKKKGTGRLNPDSQKAVARHEITLDMAHFFSSAFTLLKPHGQFLFIYPADRLSDLIKGLEPCNFRLDWIRFIHTKNNNNAKLILVSARKGGPGQGTVRPPLYLYGTDNNQTNEYKAMFKP